VIVSSVSVVGPAGEEILLPLEEVTFAYSRIEWTYTETDPVTGEPKGDIKAYWDLVANNGG
jgi:type VI secretion system secreted protein Hcp